MDNMISYNEIFSRYYSEGTTSIEKMCALKLFIVSEYPLEEYLEIESSVEDKVLLFLSELHFIFYKNIISREIFEDILSLATVGVSMKELIKEYCAITDEVISVKLIKDSLKYYKYSIIDMNRLPILSTLKLVSKLKLYSLMEVAYNFKGDTNYRSYIVYRLIVSNVSSETYFRLFYSIFDINKYDSITSENIKGYFKSVDLLYASKLNKDTEALFSILALEATENNILNIADYFLVALFNININSTGILNIKDRIFNNHFTYC